MKRTCVVMLAFLAITLTTCKKDAGTGGFTIQNFVGNVTVTTEKGTAQAEVGMNVAINSVIITGQKSMAVMLVSGRGIMRIGENSKIRITSLIEKGSEDTQIDMEQGRVFVVLAKLTRGHFKIKSAVIVASVRGTSFRVVAGAGTARLDVLTGSVKVNPVKDNQVVEDVEKTVEKNQTAELNTASADKKDIPVRKIRKEEIAEIRAEIKDIKPESIEKLDESARSEIQKDLDGAMKDEAVEPGRTNQSGQQNNTKKAEPTPAITF